MKPLKTESLFQSPWCELVAKTVTAGEAPYYSLRLPDYAAVLAVTRDGRILAVRQYRPALERYTIELPSGLVDEGETPESAARRELMEETGYRADEVQALGAMTTDNGRLSNRIWYFLAPAVTPVEGLAVEAGVELMTYSPDELARAILCGEFDHALHMGGLLLAVLQQKLAL